MRDRPLQGLSVVEGSAFVAAPSGGMTLAQLGADVIRFDQIGGGIDHKRWPLTENGASLYWNGLNKGKRSIALNLRDPEAQDLLSALIAKAGNFITNFPTKGWLDYGELSAQREDLVMVSIIGSHDGTTAVDYTVNCAIGYPNVTGYPDDPRPVNNVVPAWDLMCGQMAALGLLAADRYRFQTGHGDLVTLALTDVALAAAGMLEGIVLQSITITICILLSLLFAYRAKIIKATENFKLGVFAATGGIVLIYIADVIMSFFGTGISVLNINNSSTTSILFSLGVVVIASLNLVIDFDFIEEGAEKGAPKYMEWYGTFGLLITLVWLYLEILRMLAKMKNR